MLIDGIGNLPHFTSGGSVHLVVEWVSVLVLSLARFLIFFSSNKCFFHLAGKSVN